MTLQLTNACKECQFIKRQWDHFGKLPTKSSMCRPYWSMEQLTIIEPATSWFTITPLHSKENETVATAFDPE